MLLKGIQFGESMPHGRNLVSSLSAGYEGVGNKSSTSLPSRRSTKVTRLSSIAGALA